MTYPSPTAAKQIRFLQNLQRLLEEGSFVSTYKFALLLALADLAVAKGDRGGAPLPLTATEVAEQFITYYWRQAAPFPKATGESEILRQNSGQQAAVLNAILSARATLGATLSQIRRAGQPWNELVTRVAIVVRDMPLWKLQRVGTGVNDFLYENLAHGSTFELRPGVAFNLRLFHGQVQNMVQGAWSRWVRGLTRNRQILGEAVDLQEFLFGTERTSLSAYRSLLRDLQGGHCFYCRARLGGDPEVDHFIPWARYPIDLGHNFVLAHKGCNNDKRDMLAAPHHLERWLGRNELYGAVMERYFIEKALPFNFSTTRQIAEWAYDQAERADANVWKARGADPERLRAEWRILFYG